MEKLVLQIQGWSVREKRFVLLCVTATLLSEWSLAVGRHFWTWHMSILPCLKLHSRLSRNNLGLHRAKFAWFMKYQHCASKSRNQIAQSLVTKEDFRDSKHFSWIWKRDFRHCCSQGIHSDHNWKRYGWPLPNWWFTEQWWIGWTHCSDW